MQRRTFRTFTLLLIFASFILLACDLGSATAGKPTVVLASPPHGSQFREGEDVAFQSTATDSTGVTRVELVIDGAVVKTDSVPGSQGQQSFTLVQTWKATQGTHAVSVRAYNTSSTASDPAAITISVSAGASTPAVPATTAPTSIPLTSQPASTATAAAVDTACTNNSDFVADVTVPDGTALALGQTFNKIWRMRNNGTCSWLGGYQLVFVSGEAMAAMTAIAVPYTAPGATADLVVAMTAPNTTGTHTGRWRLKAAGGTTFGDAVTVNINVIDNSQPPSNPPPSNPPPSNPSTSCSGSPSIESFSASPSSITAGGSSTLNWGAVTNADSVEIDQGIGGVATPGNTSVSPGSTTTYTMTAHCGSTTATRQATVTVTSPPTGQPDLYVSEFSLTPSTPVKGASVHVRVAVYNQGSAPAGAFKVRWLAGASFVTPPPCTWTVGGLPASGGQVLECDASGPYGSIYDNLTTRAQVDYENSVAESNEGNNNKDLVIDVTANQPDLYITGFTLTPNPPHKGAAVHVEITIYNGGNTAAGAFKVRWMAGATFVTAPPCTWTRASMVAHGGEVLTCNAASPYASVYTNLTTRAQVDYEGSVAESNEGNNLKDMVINVLP